MTGPTLPRRAAVVLVGLLALFGPFGPFGGRGAARAQPPAEAAPPPSAEASAAQVMQALGGEQAWRDTRFLRFTLAGRRTHHWDKATGRHRVEGQTQDGKRYVVLHDLDSRQGEAWVDGVQASAEEKGPWLERAYGAWVNDTYWLLMPYKLRDPGVQLTYDHSEEIEGRTYDVLHLAFDHVGLTPGDQYWAYINRSTRLMDRWAYRLQDFTPEQPPTVWDWRNWQRYGRILLAPTRAQMGGDRTLELSDIAVFDQLPDTVFTSPQPVVP